jgi:Spy/CpxP family protein refolding chaperone
MMNTFFKTTASVVALASLLAASSAYAEPSRGDRDWQKGPPSVEEKLARISSALDLSDEQSAEMLAILQLQEKNRQYLHDRTMAIMGAEICAQKAQAEEEILSVLNTEQAELFLQMKADRQARGGDRNRSRKGREDLDCTEFEGGDS